MWEPEYDCDDMRPVLVACSACDGEGVEREPCWVYEPTLGFSIPDVNERPCGHCHGSGKEEVEAEPFTLEDILAINAAIYS